MEKETENKFLSGLLLGLLIGGGLGVFLNSQSGKRLLKSISEEGLDSILNILEEHRDTGEDYEEEDGIKEKGKGFFDESMEAAPKQRRRFFRGIGRKIINRTNHL